MKNYQSITQDGTGQLLARYGVVDHSWNVEMDFDVLTAYAIYPHETEPSFIAEYLPAKYCFWSYRTLDEALEAVLVKIKEKQEATRKIEEAGAKFEELVKKNSLDERYKNKVVEAPKKKVNPYLENLMKKARERTEEIHARVEEARRQRNRKLQMSDYVEALLNH